MNTERSNWYEVINANEVDSPSLLVFPERVQDNIDLIKKMIGDVSLLRPHIKTHKCAEAIKLQMDGGITKFKCATIAEAELLGMASAPDVLLAYQPVGPKLKRFIELIQSYPGTRYSCLVDNISLAEKISEAAVTAGLQIPVYIDINVGMNRTGILPGKVAELYQQSGSLKGIKPLGLHAYDGHIHDSDLGVRNVKAGLIYDQLKNIVAEIESNGLPKPIIVAGGSPTFPFYAGKKDVECSPGTFIYWDAGYAEAFKEQGFLPAAVLVSRVISLPGETKVCLDLGHKSVSAENTIDKRVRFLNAPDLQIISQSEEHLVAEAGEGHNYKPGDVIYLLPHHVCPTVALYERVITIQDYKVTGEWLNLARNRKITI